MPDTATTYEFIDAPGAYPTINGQEFPWRVLSPGPLVEDLGHGAHILWVPVLVEAPMPTPPVGRPNGQPIASTEETP